MNISENIRLAFRAITSNKLRTGLTLVIISIGIMALVGILTAIEGIKASLLQNFADMGSNTFNVRSESQIRRHGKRGDRSDKENPAITFDQAIAFKDNYHFPASVSVSAMVSFAAELKHQSKKTNPNVKIVGCDENYLKVSGLSVDYGRNFTVQECNNGTDVIIIGKDIVEKLFNSKKDALNKMLNIGSKKYRIIGVMAEKGSSMFKSDNQGLIPVLNGKRNFASSETTFMISCMVNDATKLDAGIDEAIGGMRSVRKLRVAEDDNFSITKSDRIAEEALTQLSSVKMAAILIAVLTLLGAGVGLMNIMLVAVNERTREIGVSKALGASSSVIRFQFLTESVTICIVGGLLGVILGVMLGNIVSLLLKAGFIMPWGWIGIGLFSTFLIGILSGWLPARKAANLDPVEALRYE